MTCAWCDCVIPDCRTCREMCGQPPLLMQALVAVAIAGILSALLCAGCAAPCLSTVTTGVEAGHYDDRRFGPGDDARVNVSFEWDATGKACAAEE